MSDLRNLLVEAAQSQPPATPPPLDSLVRRVRRRRQLTVAAVAAVAATAIVVPTLLGSNTAHNGHPTHRPSPHPTVHIPPQRAYPLCQPGQIKIRVTLSVAEPTMGTRDSQVHLHNVGSRPCSLTGRPSLALPSGAVFHLHVGSELAMTTISAGEAVPQVAPGKSIVLAPGGRANFFITTFDHEAVPKYPDCGDPRTTLSIRLHAGQGSITVGPYSLPACVGTEVDASRYTPGLYGYPATWASTSMVVATHRAKFTAFFPPVGNGVVDASLPYGVGADPGGRSVILTYPVPTSERAASRGLGDLLTITEHPWNLGDPTVRAREAPQSEPGFHTCRVAGLPAVCVPSRLPAAVNTNAADVRFDLDGTSLELHGGASLAPLVQLGASIIRSAS